MMNFDCFEILTFDCYGTLIDWESGMLLALQSILSAHQIQLDETSILEHFAKFESELEQGAYSKYRTILNGVVQRFGKEFKFNPSCAELNALADSVKNWQPFSDTVEALKVLKQRFKLVIISNFDDDLFAFSAERLVIPFDLIVTAEQVKSYKPSLNNFNIAIQKLGVSPNKILHVAGSIYHDIIPATCMGLSTVWVNRRLGKHGSGAALPAQGQPTLEVPDLKTLASMVSG